MAVRGWLSYFIFVGVVLWAFSALVAGAEVLVTTSSTVMPVPLVFPLLGMFVGVGIVAYGIGVYVGRGRPKT